MFQPHLLTYPPLKEKTKIYAFTNDQNKQENGIILDHDQFHESGVVIGSLCSWAPDQFSLGWEKLEKYSFRFNRSWASTHSGVCPSPSSTTANCAYFMKHSTRSLSHFFKASVERNDSSSHVYNLTEHCIFNMQTETQDKNVNIYFFS